MANQHHDNASAYHGSYKAYIIGFVLSVILTVIPFYMVMNGTASQAAIITTIVIFAVVQVLVHLYYFLHLDTSEEQRWNFMAIAYTFLLVFIFIGGSVWIMWHLDYNMMLR
ncbi:cytochrome o ubiquinol oxidase subunit IV [Mangrovitalea sediminis]|uniref:cytochrome o ubiquinol oxidase subunit IV n=1 Tax=Mangrovitalea sediminis TaxID=1982043 RepID=UPI000BE5167A|nr:cytochrome o ubiquinol oxidase subunit IV [Mangrovitalea sediminis]